MSTSVVINANSAPALIEAVQQADSPSRLVAAVRNLAEARLEAGIPTLITALGYNNPEAAVAALKGLVQLGEVAIPALLEQMDDYNYGARAYSFRALAEIADPRALEPLVNAVLTDFAPSVRRAAAKGLGNLRWFLLPSEQRDEAQHRALDALLTISQDGEWAIRYAAVVGLQGLAKAALEETSSSSPHSSNLQLRILERFEEMSQTETDLTVQTRVLLAQQQLLALQQSGVVTSDPT